MWVSIISSYNCFCHLLQKIACFCRTNTHAHTIAFSRRCGWGPFMEAAFSLVFMRNGFFAYDGHVNRRALRPVPPPTPLTGKQALTSVGILNWTVRYVASEQRTELCRTCGVRWYIYHSIPKARSVCSVSASTSWAACHVRGAWLVWQDKVT